MRIDSLPTGNQRNRHIQISSCQIETSASKTKAEQAKDNTAIFIFIYKCALLPRTQMERNQKRAVTAMKRREGKKINKRLSMWLYDCNIKRHTNWTVSRAPEAIPFECFAMRAITALRYPRPDAMRNNFLSKSLIHIYKWVDQKKGSVKTCTSNHLSHGKGHGQRTSDGERLLGALKYIPTEIWWWWCDGGDDGDDIVATSYHLHGHKTHKFPRMPWVWSNIITHFFRRNVYLLIVALLFLWIHTIFSGKRNEFQMYHRNGVFEPILVEVSLLM